MGHIVNAENRHFSHPLLTFILLLTGSKSVIPAFECVVQGRHFFSFFFALQLSNDW